MTQAEITCAFVPSPEHAIVGHPESPARFKGLTPDKPLDLPAPLTRTNPVRMNNERLATVHDPDYLTHLRQVVNQGSGLLDHGDTYFTPKSFRAARRAAGAAVAVTRAGLRPPHPLGVSIARPPGHHATAGQALGFCLLNNVALAARAAQDEGIRRVMIVDFDVHHGNGTQDIFYDDPSVLFVSIHQRGIFPGTGLMDERGADEGLGTNVNVPLPAGVGHRGYLHLTETLLPKLADRFQPELLLLSGGFDGHWKDPLAGLQLRVLTYYELGRQCRSLARHHCAGRMAFNLEGGYLAEVLRRSLHACVRGLAGLPPESDDLGPSQPAETDITGLLEQLLQRLN